MLPYCFICLPWLASMQATQLADLAFGHAQVEQFMRDRPEVKPVLLKEAALRNQLERGFGGLETGFHVYWDNREPDLRGADYRPRHNQEPAIVRVSKKRLGSASDKCVTLVIELEHAKSEGRYTAIRRMAYLNQMSRGDYARSMTHLEFQSIQRAREFFWQHPLPPSEAGSDYNWLLKFPTEFSEYLKSFSDDKSSNVNLIESWQQDYDELISKRKYDGSDLIPTP
jgi:hypothetical protein